MLQWLRNLFGGTELSEEDKQYDEVLLGYLELWGTIASEEELHRIALERFGLDEDGVDYVNQVLVSAALGTLRNWADSEDDPWWHAAWRLARSSRKGLLRPLRKSLTDQ